jgi:hypothetical protein
VVRQNNIKGCLLLYYLQVTGMPSVFSCSAGRRALAVMFRSNPKSVIPHSSCVTLEMGDVIIETYYVKQHCF